MGLQKLNGKQIKLGVLDNSHIADNAAIAETKLNIDWEARYQAALESKKVIDYVQMNNIAVVGGSGSVDVEHGEGIGKISKPFAATEEDYGVVDTYPVIFREKDTGNVVYVNGKEVKGNISFDSENSKFVITFVTVDGPVNLPAEVAAIDLQYPCRFNLHNVPEDFAMNEKFMDGAVDVTEIQNLKQLAKDLYGASYSLDNDGLANLGVSIKDEIVRIDGDASTAGSISNKIKVEAIDKLASAAAGDGAAMVAIQDAGSKYLALTVEGALAEVMDKVDGLKSDLASSVNGKGASMVAIEDAGGKFTATNVEGALAEIEGRVNTLESFGGAEVEATHTRDAATANNVFDVETFVSLEERLVDIETVVDAKVKELGDAVDAEEARAIAAEGVLQGNIDTVAGDLATEKTRAEGIEAGLRTDVDAMDAMIDAALVRAEASMYNTFPDMTFTSLKHRFENLEGTVDMLRNYQDQDRLALSRSTESANGVFEVKDDMMMTGYNNLAERFVDIETVVDADHKALEDLTTVVGNLNSDNDARLDALEAGLAQELIDRAADVDAEELRAITREDAIEDALEAEVTRATAAEGQLTTDLAAEVTRATTREDAIEDALEAEVVRATAAEDALDVRVDDLEAYNVANGPKIHIHAEEVYAVVAEITEYTLVNANVKATDFIGVYVNGVRQLPDTNYTKTIVDGKITKVSFSDSLIAGDNVYIEFVIYNA